MDGIERRTVLARTLDPRAIETRAHLVDALAGSIASGEKRISVTTICERAGIGRSTFYTHFRSVNELLVGTFADNIAVGAAWDLEQRLTPGVDLDAITRAGLTETVQRVQVLRPIVNYANTSGARADLERGLADVVAADMLPAVLHAAGTSEAVARRQADFLAGGLVRVLLHSLDAGPVRPDVVEPGSGPAEVLWPEASWSAAPSPEELVEELVALFPAWVTGGAAGPRD